WSVTGGTASVQKAFRQLRALRHRARVRAVRSGPHERSDVPAGSESSPQLTHQLPLRWTRREMSDCRTIGVRASFGYRPVTARHRIDNSTTVERGDGAT